VWHLVELNDGRQPFTKAEDRDGWAKWGEMPATEEAIARISVKSPVKVLSEIETQGYCQLFKDDLQTSWREKWVKPA
jgi:hypothetical protein